MARVVVWLQDAIVEFFDFSHFTDLVSLDGVLSSALDVDGDADSEGDDGDHEGDWNDHGDLAIV